MHLQLTVGALQSGETYSIYAPADVSYLILPTYGVFRDPIMQTVLFRTPIGPWLKTTGLYHSDLHSSALLKELGHRGREILG